MSDTSNWALFNSHLLICDYVIEWNPFPGCVWMFRKKKSGRIYFPSYARESRSLDFNFRKTFADFKSKKFASVSGLAEGFPRGKKNQCIWRFLSSSAVFSSKYFHTFSGWVVCINSNAKIPRKKLVSAKFYRNPRRIVEVTHQAPNNGFVFPGDVSFSVPVAIARILKGSEQAEKVISSASGEFTLTPDCTENANFPFGREALRSMKAPVWIARGRFFFFNVAHLPSGNETICKWPLASEIIKFLLSRA